MFLCMCIIWLFFFFLEAIFNLFGAFLRLFTCFLKLNEFFDFFFRISRVFLVAFMYCVFFLKGQILLQRVKLLLHVNFASFRARGLMNLTFWGISDVIDQNREGFNHDSLSRSLIIRDDLMLGRVKSFKEIIWFVDNTFSFSILRWLLFWIKSLHLN